MNLDLADIKSPQMKEQKIIGDPIQDFLVIYQKDLKILNDSKEDDETMPESKEALYQ